MVKTLFRCLVGPAVVILSTACMMHGVRAGLAQHLYFEASYGATKSDPERILASCEKADRLYPWNYLFCSRAAGAAFVNADEMTDTAVRTRLFSAAGRWCDRGLLLNPYCRELVLRKAGLIGAAGEGAVRAAEYWARYTDWHYWNPENHSILGMMYIWAGDLEKAEACASLIDKTGHAAALQREIDAELSRRSEIRRP